MFHSRRWVWIGVFLMVGILFAVRLAVFNRYAYPPSSDAGNYLTILRAFLGHDVSGTDVVHREPPLYFLLFLAPLVRLFPVFPALKVSQALVSSIIAIPFFFLMRKMIKDDAISLLTAGLFAFASGFSEMIGWGGAPNIFAIFFLLWSGYFLLCAMETGSRRDAILSGLFLSFTVGSHLITAPYYILSLILFGLGMLALRRKEAFRQIKPLLLAGIAGALFSLPYLWTTYAAILNEGYLFPKSGVSGVATNINIAELKGVFSSLLFLWFPVFILGFVWTWIRFKDKTSPLFIASLTLGSLILAFAYRSEGGRLFYFLQIPVFLILGIILLELKRGIVWAKSRGKLAYGALLLIPLVAIPVASVRNSYTRFTGAVDWYQRLDADTVEALKWLKENTEANAVIVPNNYYLAWWIEGYSERTSFCPSAIVRTPYLWEQAYQQVDTGTKVVAGNYIVDNSCLRVADTFPVPCYNPRFILNTAGIYQELLYFDDDYATLGLSSDSGRVGGIALSSAPSKELGNKDITSAMAKLNYHYVWDKVEVTRTVTVSYPPEVVMSYELNVDPTEANRFEVVALVTPGVGIEGYDIAEGRVRVTLRDTLGDLTDIELSAVGGKLLSIEFVPGSAEAPSGFRFSFNVTEPHSFAQVSIAVKSKIPSFEKEVKYSDGIELTKDYVNYFLISDVDVADLSGLSRDIRRFQLDPRFEEVFRSSNGHAVIYKVK
jgi:hypothetical protein